MSAGSALTIAVVGPAHPLKGGVTVHTTELARRLHDAGHHVDLLSWRHLYPRPLYPGVTTVPMDEPEIEPYAATTAPLSWARPDSWVRTGRRLAAYDGIVVVHVVPQIVPAHLALIAAARRGSGPAPVVITVVHNVLPHESRPGDVPLMRRFLTGVDAVIVHGREQANLARSLGAETVRTLALPAHLPGGPPQPRPPYAGPARLLALGLVRPYKGIEELLTALAEVPGPTLTIAGEFWGRSRARVDALTARPELAGRVQIIDGYVPAKDLAGLLARHDIMALTYTSATASQMALLAFEHGLGVLASAVGSFPRDVSDGVDGLLVPPSDPAALVRALRRLEDPAFLRTVMAGVRPPDLSGPWADYVGSIEALVATSTPATVERPPRAPLATRVRTGVADRAKGVVAVLRPRLELRAGDFAEWIRPTDVLALDVDADLAARTARELGLPRGGSPPADWAALGALAGLHVLADDGRHSALIVDRSGRGSPFERWARAAGFAPVAADQEVDAEAGTIDMLVQLHPNDVDAAAVGDLLGHATWVLRSGGLLVVTVALGPENVAGTLGAADLRAVLAHADNAGLRLVGDLDGDLTERMRRAARHAQDPDASYAIARLTWRRR